MSLHEDARRKEMKKGPLLAETMIPGAEGDQPLHSERGEMARTGQGSLTTKGDTEPHNMSRSHGQR